MRRTCAWSLVGHGRRGACAQRPCTARTDAASYLFSRVSQNSHLTYMLTYMIR